MPNVDDMKNAAEDIAMGAAREGLRDAAVKTVVHETFTIWDKIVGNSMAQWQMDEFKELNNIYRPFHGKDNDRFILIDGKVSQSILTTDWVQSISQIRKNGRLVGNYVSQALNIAKEIGNFLKIRNRGYFNGYLWVIGVNEVRNDILDVYMNDLLDWSLNTLPRIDYDESGIKSLQKKLDYINTVKYADKKTLYSFKYYSYCSSNHLETLRLIVNEIESCILYATQEKSKKSIRDLMVKSCDDTKAFLSAAVKMMYYTRSGKSEPFEFGQYYQPEMPLTKSDKTNAKIKKTHIGSIIFQIIHLAKIHNIGSLPESKSSANNKSMMTLNYYDDNFNSIVLSKADIKAKKANLPPWVYWGNANKSSVNGNIINRIQQTGSLTLKVTQILELLGSASALAADRGNSWAYGDNTAKEVVARLLFAWKKIIEECKDAFDSLINEQSEMHDNYCDAKHKKNGSAFDNYNLLLSIKPEFDGQFAKMCAHIENIQKQMDEYPIDAEMKLNQEKEQFYRSLDNFCKVNFPQCLSMDTSEEEQKQSPHFNYQFSNDVFFKSPQIYGLTYQALPKGDNSLYDAVCKYLEKERGELGSYLAEEIKSKTDKYQNNIKNSGKDIDSYVESVKTRAWSDQVDSIELMNLLSRPIAIIGPDKKVINWLDITKFKGEPIFVYCSGVKRYDGLVLQANRNSREVLNYLKDPLDQSTQSCCLVM